MIFTSLGILVVALCFLIAGIIKSSVALLVVSLVATVAGAIILLATADLARRRAWEQAIVPQAGGPAPQWVAPGVSPVPTQVAPFAPNGAVAPLVGYDDMTAEQVGKLVSSGALSAEQLSAVRDYERSRAARKTILDRVERALR